MWCINIFILCVLFLASSVLSFASDDCQLAFPGSKLFYSNKSQKDVKKSKELFPTFVDPIKDRNLQEKWNVPYNQFPLLNVFLPKDVYFLKHQQFKADAMTSVKMAESGDALIVRAHYMYNNIPLATNVVFSSRALHDNIQDTLNKNWLVGTHAKAAILFLHGGGTNSTGAHVSRSLVTHFSKYKVDVVSLDLPWHGTGHREYFNLESDVQAIQHFVQKYIPPNVPLFVWGHSWGALFAEQIMRMSDRPHNEGVFHKNLKGVMIMSGIVDSAVGGNYKEKYQNMVKRQKHAQTNKKILSKVASAEKNLLQKMVQDGKVNPLGEFHLTASILGFDQTIPKHKGKNYVPGIVVVGKGDSLVYLGFEDLFSKAYEPLQNIELHILDTLPLHQSQNTEKGYNSKKLHTVGHLLGDYTTKDGTEIIDISLAKKFMNKQLGIKKLDKVVVNTDAVRSIVPIVQLVANDLSFREYLKDTILSLDQKTGLGVLIRESNDLLSRLSQELLIYTPHRNRVQYFLEKLSRINNAKDAELKQIISEYHYIMNPAVSEKLNNKIFISALLTLKDKINTVQITDKNILDDISQEAQQILVTYIPNYKNKPSVKRKKTILEKSFRKANTIEGVKDILNREHIVDSAHRKKILGVMQEYITNQNIIKIYENPIVLLNELKKISDLEGSSDTFRHKYTQLVFVLNNINISSKSSVELKNEHNNISKEYFAQLHIIIQQIKSIKTGLQSSIAENSTHSSLIKETIQLHKSIDIMIKSEDEMHTILDSLQVDIVNKKLHTSEVNEILIQNRSTINKFTDKYTQYINNIEILQKKVITAMENGEFGEALKKVVIDLYGYNSGGNIPKIGIKSSYTKLQDLITSLAALESKIYEVHILLKESEIEYNSLIQSVVRSPEIQNIKNKHLLSFFTKVSENLNYIDLVPVHKVLEGKYSYSLNLDPKTITQKDKTEIMDYLINNRNVFLGILKNWHALLSTPPPLLPTVK